MANDNWEYLGIGATGTYIIDNKLGIDILHNDHDKVLRFLTDNTDFSYEKIKDMIIIETITEDDLPQIFMSDRTKEDSEDLYDEEIDIHTDERNTGMVTTGTYISNRFGDYATAGLMVDGGRGIITTGHAFERGDVIYNGQYGLGRRIGVVTRKTFNGRDDSAYISLDYGISVNSPPYVISFSLPRVGTVYQIEGAATGRTSGMVTRTDYSYFIGGYNWTGMIEVNRRMQGGDSGGTLYQQSGNSRTVYGLTHSTTSSNSYYLPITRVNLRG